MRTSTILIICKLFLKPCFAECILDQHARTTNMNGVSPVFQALSQMMEELWRLHSKSQTAE